MQTNRTEKINLIDFATFEQRQKSDNKNASSHQIRNAKFRKKHKNDENNFNLAAWITQPNRRMNGNSAGVVGSSSSSAVQKARSHFKKGATLIKKSSGIKKSGKISENRRKKLTRLKKTIMRYRVLKHQNLSGGGDATDYDDDDDGGHLLFKVAAAKSKTKVDVPIATAVLKASPNINFVEPLIMQMNQIDVNETATANATADKTAEIIKEDKNLTVIADRLSHLSIHSRRFREYCDNCTTPDLAKIIRELLGDLNFFQRRAYAKNPVKANAHRRLVVGFREAQNYLKIPNKVKLVIIATDCEKCTETGGLDGIIASIKLDCQFAGIPYCFPLDRRQLAYALHKKGIVSCVAVLDYDGAREKFAQFLAALEIARQKYLATSII